MPGRVLARRPTLAGIVSVALWMVLLAYAALVAHDFYQHVERMVFLSVDDGLSNEAYTLASQGRYGFLSSPELSGIERHHGELSYGPWYFYLAGGLIWLFGYSLTLVRSIHLWVILGSLAAASAWFRGPGRAAVTSLFGLTILSVFVANQWPMARPDSMVSVFAIALIVCAGLGLTRGGARYWFGAGLAASCGAFTHLIAASLVVSSLVLFTVGAVRHWLAAEDRTRARRDLLASFVAFACGGLLGAVMFYASFGFRFGDQLRLFAAYRALVASTDSYGTVLNRHLFVAFRYLSPNWTIWIVALIASAWMVVALARLLSRDSRSLIYGYVLPPITVWTGYIISNGWYTNQHKGYAILHEVMMSWVLASLVWIAISLAGRGSRLARTLPLLAGVLVVAQGVRQIESHLEAMAPRASAVSRWVPIDGYTDHVLSHIPARSTAWGSVMYGIETPDRLQLVQLEDAFYLMYRVDVSRRAALAPDYLVWGYPEERDNTLSVLRGGDSLLGRLAQLTEGAQYRVVSLVAAAPYGVTRIYAKTESAVVRTLPLPDVSVFDADTQRWLSRVEPAMPVDFIPVAPVQFAIGYEPDPRPAQAARTVSAMVPSGRYLIRVGITPGVGDTTHRLLTATSPEMRRQRIGELGPDGDFTSYFANDRHVVMLGVHGGGPLDISQFDDGAGARIDSVEVFPVAALLDPNETPGTRLLPAPASWTVPPGVRATALALGGVEIEGDASRDGYQLISPKIAADAGYRDHLLLHIDMTVGQGRACLGVLNGTKTGWLVSPDARRADVTFLQNDTRGVYVVLANCNESDTGNPATRLTVLGGRYTIGPAPLYTDRLMSAVDAKPVGPSSADASGAVPGLITAPADLQVTRLLLEAPADSPLIEMAFRAPIVRADGEGWIISGSAESAYSYLLQSKTRSFDKNTRLMVTGTIEKGGLTIGLLSRGQWSARVNVTEPGPFTVVIAPPASAAYAIVAANALSGSLDTAIAIAKLRVVHAP